MLEQEKFLKWHTEEKSRGLVGIRFLIGDGSVAKNATSEEFFREANYANGLYEQKKFISREDLF